MDVVSGIERLPNDKTNGLIRQYLPKSRYLTTLTGPELRKIENRLNYQPVSASTS